jgi:type IV secretory pathway TrbD component
MFGLERRLFMLAAFSGAAVFNSFGSLLGGILMFALLYMLARWATATDPQFFEIVFRAASFKTRFDCAKAATTPPKGGRP